MHVFDSYIITKIRRNNLCKLHPEFYIPYAAKIEKIPITLKSLNTFSDFQSTQLICRIISVTCLGLFLSIFPCTAANIYDLTFPLALKGSVMSSLGLCNHETPLLVPQLQCCVAWFHSGRKFDDDRASVLGRSCGIA